MSAHESSRPPLVTRPFVVITASALAYFMSYAMLIPALPRFVEGPLDGGKVAVGLVSGAFGISALALRPLAGAFADRHGRRIMVLAGTASVALATLGLTGVADLLPTLGLRLVAGAGEAFVFVGAASVITDLAPPERRGEALSLFSIALYLGVAIGPTVAETVLDRWGFDAAFLGSAALTMVAFLLALPTPETRPDRDEVVARISLRTALHPSGIFPGLVMLTSVWGFAGYMAFVPLYATQDLGLSGARSILLMYGSILVLIRAFGARIPDRFGAARAGKVGLTGSAIGLAIIGLWGSVTGLIVGTIVFASGQALAFPAFMALTASAAPPAQRAAAVGTTTAFIDLGFFIGPVSLGPVAAVFGTQRAFLGGALIAVAGVVFQVAAADRIHAGATS